MSKPEIKEKASGCELTWEGEKVNIVVSRIKPHRDNRVTAWLVINTTNPNAGGLLHQAEFNLASTQTMRGLVNFMNERMEGVPWDSIIEQLRFYVLERVRRGEPVLTLWSNAEDISPPNYLVDPVLPDNQPTIIFGDPGVCKSNMALLLYICLILPWYDNPLGLIAPEESIIPLYLDYESHEDTQQWRVKKLQAGMEVPAFPLYYRRCNQPIADDIEQIQQHIDGIGARILIVDSLAQAAGGKFLEGDVATNYFQALRQLKLPSLTIAQNQKDPEKKTKSILGSGIYQYYSRSIWELRKAQSVGSEELHINMIHRKANESMIFKPMTYRFFFNENKTIVSRERMKDVPEFRQDMNTQERVFLAVMDLGRQDAATIADAAGVSEAAAKAALTRLKKDNRVINFTEDHTWGAISEFEE